MYSPHWPYNTCSCNQIQSVSASLRWSLSVSAGSSMSLPVFTGHCHGHYMSLPVFIGHCQSQLVTACLCQSLLVNASPEWSPTCL